MNRHLEKELATEESIQCYVARKLEDKLFVAERERFIQSFIRLYSHNIICARRRHGTVDYLKWQYGTYSKCARLYRKAYDELFIDTISIKEYAAILTDLFKEKDFKYWYVAMVNHRSCNQFANDAQLYKLAFCKIDTIG